MNLDGNSLLASLVVSSIGFVAFAYGKKQHRFPQMLVGVAMMVYPYFISSVPWMLVVAVLLMGALGLMVRVGL